jgi:hypothetical protein
MSKRTGTRLLSTPNAAFAALALLAFVLGYVGIYQYVHTDRGAPYGTEPWYIAYYDLQLFVLGSQPLEAGPPFNPALEVARYLAAGTTVYAVALAGYALFGEAWRRSKRRRMRGHAIVVGDTAQAKAIARHQAARSRVLEIDSGDTHSLQAAGIAGAAVVYACAPDSDDAAANLATALAATSLRKGSDLRVNVAVSDPWLAIGLKARRLMKDDAAEPVVDFFSVDQTAARQAVATGAPLPQPRPHIVVAGASAFGQGIIVAHAERFLREADGGRLEVTLVDEHAAAVADQLSDRWPSVATVCEFRASTSLQDVAGADRAYICYDDEQRALTEALRAVPLWHGGPGSLIVRLSQLARHGSAFQGENALLDDLDGRLAVVNVADVGAALAVQQRDPVRDLAEAVHERYLAAQLVNGVAMGSTPAMRPWSDLSEDFRQSNRAQARHFTVKLRLIGCTIAPRSARRDAIRLSDEEIETLGRHEHDRWMAERTGQGWTFGPERDDRRKHHPDLIPWASLTDVAKEKDRDAARNLPATYEPALNAIGLQIVRLTRDDRP